MRSGPLVFGDDDVADFHTYISGPNGSTVVEHPILFLDIDGVLNGHEWDKPANSTRIRYACIQQLNRVIAATGCRIVLSSAWRYMVHGGAMTETGFEYLLRTHGTVGARVIGVTCCDEDIPERGAQIRAWVDEHKPSRFAAVDDIEFEFAAHGIPYVLTNPGVGMRASEADALIAKLEGR